MLIDDLAVKSLGENRIGGYGILWGDVNQRDLHDEFFTAKTADLTAVFEAMGAVPWLFHHAADKKLKSTVVGVVDKMEMDETGLWYEAKIREHEIYKKFVRPLLSARALFSSSGAFPGSKEKNKKTGEITRWTIGEVSATTTPADHHQLDQAGINELKLAYKSVGLNLDLLDRKTRTNTKTPTQIEAELARSRLKLSRLNLVLQPDSIDVTQFKNPRQRKAAIRLNASISALELL